MDVQLPTWGIVLLFSGSTIISAAVTAWSYLNRNKRAAEEFMYLSASGMLWSSIALAQILVTNPELTYIIGAAEQIITGIPAILWFVFALKYTGQTRFLTKTVYGILAAELGIFTVLLITNPYHNLLFTETTLITEPFSTIVYKETLLRGTHSIIHYGLIAAGMILLFRTFNQNENVNRTQILSLVIASVFPAVFHLAGDLQAIPSELNTSSFGLAVFSSFGAVALYRYSPIDLSPTQNTRILENINDAVVVIDTEKSVNDANNHAYELLDEDKLVGRTIYDVFEQTVSDQIEFPEMDTENYTVEANTPERQYYNVHISPIWQNETLHGWVMIARDITTLRKNQIRLEQQNQQLEKFASTVSHDLRNPLNVAQAYTEMAADTQDTEHFDVIRESNERMNQIIEDVLALARQGKMVEETEPVTLRTVVQDAWNAVSLPETTLEIKIETGATILADETRVKTILENLFRNAEEHGDATEITVRTVDAGFIVEDNGGGIPEEDYDDVFEYGYSTNDNGTGFGLNIVKTIAEAHEWTVSIGESPTGGAQFRFQDVTYVSEDWTSTETDADGKSAETSSDNSDSNEVTDE